MDNKVSNKTTKPPNFSDDFLTNLGLVFASFLFFMLIAIVGYYKNNESMSLTPFIEHVSSLSTLFIISMTTLLSAIGIRWANRLLISAEFLTVEQKTPTKNPLIEAQEIKLFHEELKSLQNERNTGAQSIQKLHDQIKQEELTNADLKSHNNELSDQLKKAEEKQEELQSKIGELAEKQVEAIAQLDNLTKQKEELQSPYALPEHLAALGQYKLSTFDPLTEPSPPDPLVNLHINHIIQKPLDDVVSSMRQSLAAMRTKSNMFIVISLPFLIGNVGYIGYTSLTAVNNVTRYQTESALYQFAIQFIPKLTTIFFLQIMFFSFFRQSLKLIEKTHRYENLITMMELKIQLLKLSMHAKTPNKTNAIMDDILQMDLNNTVLKGETTVDIELAKAQSTDIKTLQTAIELIQATTKGAQKK